MQVKQSIPGIWVYTTGGAFNAARPEGYASFLDAGQKARVERIRQARLLYSGGDGHRQYFLDEQRTQFDFPAVRVGGRMVQLYLSFNVLGLISRKSADLLFGQEPLVRVDDEIQQAKLAELAERTNLHQVLTDAAIDGSAEGESFLESCIYQGEVYLKGVPADEIFPLGDVMPDRQYERYVRYNVRNAGTDQPGGAIWLLLERVYSPGLIERRLYQLDRDGKKERELDVRQWNESAPPEAKTATGVPRNTITWIPNGSKAMPVSDYDGLHDLQDELNAKQTQIGRVLAKHSDPKLAFPSEAFDAEGNVRSDHETFPFNDPKQIPTYITWNAELAHALADRQFTLNGLLILAEMSPGLLGLKEGAAPDAARKLRLEATNALAKAQRKATAWKAGMRRALGVCMDLDQTIPGNRYEVGSIGVEVRDGIPVDELDQAQTISLLRAAEVMSQERGVETQLVDPAARKKEIGLLKKEADAKTPSVLLGGAGREAGEASDAPLFGDPAADESAEVAA